MNPRKEYPQKWHKEHYVKSEFRRGKNPNSHIMTEKIKEKSEGYNVIRIPEKDITKCLNKIENQMEELICQTHQSVGIV